MFSSILSNKSTEEYDDLIPYMGDLQNVHFTGKTSIKFRTLHQVKLYQVLKIEFD